MATFRCARFPEGVAYIRTPSGIVVPFHDGLAEVDDPDVAAALLQVPPVFRISRVDTPPPDPVPDPVPDAGLTVPAGMSVPTALAWVGDDPARAQAVMDAETAPGGKNRATLIARLESVLAEDGKPDAEQ